MVWNFSSTDVLTEATPRFKSSEPFAHVSVGRQSRLTVNHCVAYCRSAENRTLSVSFDPTVLETVRLPQAHSYVVFCA